MTCDLPSQQVYTFLEEKDVSWDLTVPLVMLSAAQVESYHLPNKESWEPLICFLLSL